MTTIRINYNPFNEKIQVRVDDRTLDKKQNRIMSFADSLGFAAWLMPYHHKYQVWEGLLQELMEEVNDDELDIVFEGRQSDFDRLETAFTESKEDVVMVGYRNNWKLFHLTNYERENIIQELLNSINNLSDYAVGEKDIQLLTRIKDDLEQDIPSQEMDRIYKKICGFIERRRMELEHDGSDFKEANLNMLKLIENEWVRLFALLEQSERSK